MKKYLFKNPLFKSSAVAATHYPTLRSASGDLLPEIAVFGRSNVGKSSLLNSLFLSKGIVKTSATPGKTQCLNFFTLNNELSFVDLPGYGYAQVPLKTQQRWGPMIQEYLEKREALQLILFLFDIRRIPSEEDKALFYRICAAGRPAILILTKIDKLGVTQRDSQIRKITAGLRTENIPIIHHSAVKGIGRKELSLEICKALHERNHYDPHE